MSATKFKLVRVTDRTEIPLLGDLLVGRLEDSGLRITQGMPSRRHAQISLLAGEVWVEDLGSANGTFVNGARIDAKTKIKSRDRLRFDVEEFDFHVESEANEADDDKTKYRKSDMQPVAVPLMPVQPVPVPPPPIQPPPIQPPPIQAVPVQAVSAESNGILKRPGAWADPDSDEGGAHKTKFMDPAALKSLLDHAPLPAARVVQVDTPHLLVISGSASDAMIELQVGKDSTTEWTIGSGPEREVVFIDSGVSALHAKIINDGARWKLLDQMSANGTFVNGKRSNVSFLSGGDRLRFGPVECEFKLPGASMQAPVRRGDASSSSSAKNRLPVIALIAIVALAATLLTWWLLR